jgi:hypothetical protein
MNRAERWQKLIELEIVKGIMPERKWDLFEAYLDGAKLNGADRGLKIHFEYFC